MNPFRPRREGRVIILSDSILKYASFGGHGFLRAIPGANVQVLINLINQGFIQDWSRIGCVLVHVGTNDVDNGQGAGVLPKLKILANLIQSRNRNVGFIISGILPRPKDYERTKSIIFDINLELQEWAASEQSIHFYQSYRQFLYKPMGKKQKTVVKKELFSDRCKLHLNEKGLAILLPLLKNQIVLFRRGDILKSR